MTLALYAQLDGDDPGFDGHRARVHLERHLAFDLAPAAGSPLAASFREWADGHARWIGLREPTAIMTPPRWFG